MDGICRAVLGRIFALGVAGRYIVVSADELCEGLDCELPDEASLKKALKSLNAEGYIDLKYTGGNMFCLAPIKPAPEEKPDFSEALNTGERDKLRSGEAQIITSANKTQGESSATEAGSSPKKFNKMQYVLSFACAFLGAATGAAAVCSLFTLF